MTTIGKLKESLGFLEVPRNEMKAGVCRQALQNIKLDTEGWVWEYSSVVEYLLSVNKAVDSISSDTHTL